MYIQIYLCMYVVGHTRLWLTTLHSSVQCILSMRTTARTLASLYLCWWHRCPLCCNLGCICIYIWSNRMTYVYTYINACIFLLINAHTRAFQHFTALCSASCGCALLLWPGQVYICAHDIAIHYAATGAASRQCAVKNRPDWGLWEAGYGAFPVLFTGY